jgi:hypothetical protein
VSRVRFQVPVVLPMGKGTQEDDGTPAFRLSARRSPAQSLQGRAQVSLPY